MKNVASEAKNYHWHEYLIKGNNLLLKFFYGTGISNVEKTMKSNTFLLFSQLRLG